MSAQFGWAVVCILPLLGVAIYLLDLRGVEQLRSVTARYRGPTLSAAQGLQSRLYEICDGDDLVTKVLTGGKEWETDMIQYTCFLIGRYLTWSHIWGRENGSLSLTARKLNVRYSTLDNDIRAVLSRSSRNLLEKPFCLPLGSQLAMAELMVVADKDWYRCIDYAAFCARWEHDDFFREWFVPLKDGLSRIVAARSNNSGEIPDHRLRSLQHVLVERVGELELTSLTSLPKATSLCISSPECSCHGGRCGIFQHEKKVGKYA